MAEDRFSGLSPLGAASALSELSRTSRVCSPPYVRSGQSWLSNGRNGRTGITKPHQFACWAIMGLMVDVHAPPVVAPSPSENMPRTSVS